MAKITICLVLSAILVVQLAQARYGPRGFVLRQMFEDGMREKVPFKNTNAQTAFVNEQMREITNILEETVTAAADILRKVVKEANSSQNQSPAFLAQLTNMTMFTESVGRLLQAPEQTQKTWVFEEFEELYHFMDRYEVAHLTTEGKYFKRLLDQNEFQTLKMMFGIRCDGFVQGFDEAVTDYIASLTPEQKEFESKFIYQFQMTTGDKNYNNMEWLEHVFSRFNVKVPKVNH